MTDYEELVRAITRLTTKVEALTETQKELDKLVDDLVKKQAEMKGAYKLFLFVMSATAAIIAAYTQLFKQ